MYHINPPKPWMATKTMSKDWKMGKNHLDSDKLSDTYSDPVVGYTYASKGDFATYFPFQGLT